MKVLVTGGSGFVGRRLIEKLTMGPYHFMVDNVDPREGKSVLDFESDEQYNLVFYCAGKTDVPESLINARPYFDLNVWGAYRIFQMFSSSRLIYIGSCVADPCVSPYGLSKKLGEVVTGYFKNSVTARLLNLFGEEFRTHVVFEFAKRMLHDEDIYIVGDGTAKRDYVYIDDAIDFTIKLALSDVTGTVDVGYGVMRSISELFYFMAEFYGYKKTPIYGMQRKCDQDSYPARNSIGGIGWPEGLIKTLEYYREIGI